MVTIGGSVPGTVDENVAGKALRFHRFQQYGFCQSLILMVGERGFEPPTPWSQTGFCGFLKCVEIEWK
jgi:hypothetical protein